MSVDIISGVYCIMKPWLNTLFLIPKFALLIKSAHINGHAQTVTVKAGSAV